MLFKLIQVKLFRKFKYGLVDFIQKSLRSGITQMCFKKRKRTQILTTNKTLIKTRNVQQTKHQLLLNINRTANIRKRSK